MKGMVGLNICAVFTPERDKVLMCLRRKNPYKGKYNLPGGHIEAGENPMDAAYRELFEETAISREDVELTHLMDFVYHHHIYGDERGILLEAYFGILRHNVEVYGEENDLYWMPMTENFFDSDKFGGDGNLGHLFLTIDGWLKNTP